MKRKRPDPSVTDANEILSSITNALVGHFDMQTLLDQVVSTSMASLHAEVCSIFLLERRPDKSVLTMKAGSGFAPRLVQKAEYQLGEGFTGYIAKHKKGFNIRSREQLETLKIDGEPIWQGKHDEMQWPSKQSEFRNCIALPLIIKGECLGVIKVENKLTEFGTEFSDDDYRYLETISNVVALAIENAKLHHQAETQLKAIAGKAAHRIHNQATNYDGIELELADEVGQPAPDRTQLQSILNRLRQTTKSLKRMTEEFKNYGRPLVLERGLCDVNRIIDDEIWLAKPPDGVTITPELDPELPQISIDAGRFAEAIKELLRNSIKAILKNHGRAGGRIKVTSERVEHVAGPDARPVGRPTPCIRISVQDDGPGFPEGFPIFEPFHSTDPRSTGLGLATVKELVEAHGGRIRGIPGKGAQIEMIIPIVQGPQL